MMSNAALNIGKSILDLSRLHKKTQTELSDVTGITTVGINRFFKGHSELSLSNIILLALELGIDLEKIFADEVQKISGGNKNTFQSKAEMYSYLFENLPKIPKQTALKSLAWTYSVSGNKELPSEINEFIKSEITDI